MEIRRVTSVVALLAIAVWLGGLVALGAIAAPVVFSIVSLPTAADAMTVVFRRFDLVAMTCAAAILVSEALCALGGRFDRVDILRSAVSSVAAGSAVFEGIEVSPRIAELHAAGVSRGLGSGGIELARLHGVAELLGNAQVSFLAVAVALHVAALARSHDPSPPRAQSP
jgi:hypothetical protein